MFYDYCYTIDTMLKRLLMPGQSQTESFGLMEEEEEGPYEMPGRLLKWCAIELAGFYTVMFQASIDQAVVPA